ncbi:hypothetical protein Atep_31270 (plasmid) [Allochromatium tepidum]|uniref:Uncharacterized protein n=1 Tax=Allochromatium tepidum TaxID=553982 RepID=A0ABN6GJ82_9GAMM|nr:hypothetical protein Atep_31270 [Allochromatium tepidum]
MPFETVPSVAERELGAARLAEQDAPLKLQVPLLHVALAEPVAPVVLLVSERVVPCGPPLAEPEQ